MWKDTFLINCTRSKRWNQCQNLPQWHFSWIVWRTDFISSDFLVLSVLEVNESLLERKDNFLRENLWKFLNKRKRWVAVVVSKGIPALCPAALVIITEENVPQTPPVRDVGSISWVQVEIRHVPEISNWCFQLDEFEKKYHRSSCKFMIHLTSYILQLYKNIEQEIFKRIADMIRASLEYSINTQGSDRIKACILWSQASLEIGFSWPHEFIEGDCPKYDLENDDNCRVSILPSFVVFFTHFKDLVILESWQ